MENQEEQKPKKKISKRVTGLTREVSAQILNLATSSLGLVAALAWNDAVQAIFKEYFPTSSGVIAKIVYALVISTLIVIITLNLTKLSKLAKGEK
jgi:uncharacterized membrane protein YidH (DUF202 family)